jgi:adenine-specific DNA-methyltransferase
MKRNNIAKSRYLRKNQTAAEKKLWEILRNRGLSGMKFRRQFAIDKYILDFYAPECKLCIEADGGQHYTEEGKHHDEIRTKVLFDLGIQVLRFSDRDILSNEEGVCEVIQRVIEAGNTPSPQSSPPL